MKIKANKDIYRVNKKVKHDNYNNSYLYELFYKDSIRILKCLR